MTGEPRNSIHFLRNPVEKAKNENPSVRYSDAGALLCGVEKAIEYHQDKTRRAQIGIKIINGTYDDDVDNYIYCLSSSELCKTIVEIPMMASAVSNFIESDEKFGRIVYKVILHNLAYVAQEIAARILNDVAYGKNRFDMQRLVDSLIERGVDPLIESILK